MKTLIQSLYLTVFVVGIPVHAAEPGIAVLTSFSGEDREPSPSPNGNYIAYLSDRKGNHTNQLWIIDLTTGETSPLVDKLMVSSPPAWHPDGQLIVFTAKKRPNTLKHCGK